MNQMGNQPKHMVNPSALVNLLMQKHDDAYLEPRNVTVPRSEALGMLGSHSSCSPVRATEDNRAVNLPRRHVQRLCCRVNDLVNALHGKVKCHEFAHRLQARESRANCDTAEASLRDGRVLDAVSSILLQQSPRNLMREHQQGNKHLS